MVVGEFAQETDLLVIGAKLDKQVVDLIEHFFDARIAAVDFVDGNDARQT